MINRCSVNVTDLSVFRRTQSGRGGDGTDVLVVSGLRAHHERSESGSKSSTGRDATITDTLLIDGINLDTGAVLDIRAHDFVQWTDLLRGSLTDKLALASVSPFTIPGQGDTLAHVQLDVGS